ncbi:hypothetical protein ADA01nite_43220 [Aneurinibacillus danicus]|uniref:Uncharacterized protein n=1 Tax=Aneurinibacillus danicus TaxID=267746 RepID=A0A511VI59_9BACL|nr:hypothetical protein ADA01nite_43220 [Aneurinibacillus danicus]
MILDLDWLLAIQGSFFGGATQCRMEPLFDVSGLISFKVTLNSFKTFDI